MKHRFKRPKTEESKYIQGCVNILSNYNKTFLKKKDGIVDRHRRCPINLNCHNITIITV